MKCSFLANLVVFRVISRFLGGGDVNDAGFCGLVVPAVHRFLKGAY